jgi:hypothetical protein
MEVVGVVAQLALSIAATYWIVRRDMRKLPAQQLARCWNDASLWCAVVGFSFLCIPIHFAKSRRSLSGLALGLVWALSVALLLSLVATLFE